MNIPRREWQSALCALHANEVKEMAAKLTRDVEVSDVALPHGGLGLLTLRDGAFHESFYLGEIPVARSDVMLRIPGGEEIRGGAIIVDDRAQFARSIAILDAVLTGRFPGWEQAAILIERGIGIRMQKDSERKQMLAATRVDFSLLGQEDEDE
jgi:alpha-D-ribose 1-methylphosphonate 5-triphosphate synthase subunit PhnG